MKCVHGYDRAVSGAWPRSSSRSKSRRVSSCPIRNDILEQRGGRAVVGVVMGVNQVRHGVADALCGGDLVDSPPQVVADAGGASNSTTPSGVTRNADW